MKMIESFEKRAIELPKTERFTKWAPDGKILIRHRQFIGSFFAYGYRIMP